MASNTLSLFSLPQDDVSGIRRQAEYGVSVDNIVLSCLTDVRRLTSRGLEVR